MGFLVASTWDVRIETGLTLGFGPEHMEGGRRHPLLLTDREGTQGESRRQGQQGRAEFGAEKSATSPATLSNSWGWAGGVNPGDLGRWMRPPRGECR